MAKVYLQRHTRVDVPPQICYGISDIALHQEFEQVDLPQVLSRIRDINIDKIYSSPLLRCRTLADKIARSQQLREVIIDSRLMELNFGDWELMRWDEIFSTPQGVEWGDNYKYYPTPNGESFEDLVMRARSLYEDICNQEQDIIVVTHSGFIRALWVALGVTSTEAVWNIKIEYGELIELHKSDERE